MQIFYCLHFNKDIQNKAMLKNFQMKQIFKKKIGKAIMKFCIWHSVNKTNVFIEVMYKLTFVYHNERKQNFQDEPHKIRILKHK